MAFFAAAELAGAGGGPGGSPGGPPAAPTGAAAPVGSAATPANVSNRADTLHQRRDAPGILAEERALLEGALGRAPGDYGLLWRVARAYFWLSDDPGIDNDARSKWGKLGWDCAERAITANPAAAEGYYWAAVNMGSYALGLGVVRALTLGLEGKFKDRLGRAGALAPTYQFGGVDLAWGRFYEKLPWPKRDHKKAEEHLRQALKLFPSNLRARVFLADTLIETGRLAEAKQWLEQVAAAKVGAYDPPEERRAKALGDGLRARLGR
jgi:tetratricopeptide (TPR) repeat protein